MKNFTIDAPVVYWDNVDDSAFAEDVHYGHFAGVSPDGRPMAYSCGRTSHSNGTNKPVPWDNCVSLEEYQLMQHFYV
jgi:hypothetical protein